MTLRELVHSSDFLLRIQKSRLLDFLEGGGAELDFECGGGVGEIEEVLGEKGEKEEEEDRNYYYSSEDLAQFAYEVFYHLFGISEFDVNPYEQLSIRYLSKEYAKVLEFD